MNHSNLMVYQRALNLVQDIRRSTRNVGMDWSTLDQITRASLSITANIAEGAGRKGPRERIQFYHIARSSAAETYSHFEVIAPERNVDPLKLDCWKAELIEVSKMLYGLIRRQQSMIAGPPTRGAQSPQSA